MSKTTVSPSSARPAGGSRRKHRNGAPSRRALPDPREPIAVEPFQPLIAMVLEAAERDPSAPALVLGARTWSYGELRTAALALAAELEELGIGPGDAVAVTGAKCHGLITSLLAVLARNAVLVPLDPLLPARRRHDMLWRAGARILIEAGQTDGMELIDVESLGARRFSIPAEPTVGERERGVAAGYELPAIDGDDPAYLLFTSGTTGEPKGIVGRQRGLSHFLGWERDATGIGPGDRTAQLTGLSFDVVLRDIFLPLVSGAALHLPPLVPGTTPPADLLQFLRDDRITLIHAVPTIATFWLSDVPEGFELPDLRWVLFAGEPLPGALVRRWRERFSTPRIGNLYGPTETTLAKCFAEIGPEPEPGVQPVGHAMPGAQALVLDGDRECASGELGEIVIRTPYRSLGYLGASGDPRPPFIQNPFTDDPSDLVYRTGDRGSYRPDGVLEIHGRLDDQVKILGVRIEPSEVAAELGSHPSVRACTVVARPDAAGDTALVAYVVPQGDAFDEYELRDYLADRMLAAKVPRLFVRLDALPRTPNGKVDRKALPDPDWAAGAPLSTGEALAAGAASAGLGAVQAGAGAPITAAGGDATVDAIRAIFTELLGRPVGPDDDFFRLGGHSLLAARLIPRIEARTGVRVQVRSLFRHPTPRGLAGVVEGETGPDGAAIAAKPLADGRTPAGGIPDSVIPVQTNGTRPPVFVIPGVGSRILFLRHLARHLGDDQPLFALHTRHLDDGRVYEHIEDLAARYVRDLRVVRPFGPYRLLGFSYGGLVALEVATQLLRAGEQVAFLGVVDTRLPGLQQHGPWSVPRSIPRRLLNLAALVQPLSGPARREYLRNRVLIARQNARAHALEWVHDRVPEAARGALPEHPYGPEEMEWLTADRLASRRYDPPRYPGRITYFWAQHSQRPPSVYDHREGWAEVAGGGLEVIPIPGSHLTVLVEPLVRSTAAAIRRALPAKAAAAPTGADVIREPPPGMPP